MRYISIRQSRSVVECGGREASASHCLVGTAFARSGVSLTLLYICESGVGARSSFCRALHDALRAKHRCPPNESLHFDPEDRRHWPFKHGAPEVRETGTSAPNMTPSHYTAPRPLLLRPQCLRDLLGDLLLVAGTPRPGGISTVGQKTALQQDRGSARAPQHVIPSFPELAVNSVRSRNDCPMDAIRDRFAGGPSIISLDAFRVPIRRGIVMNAQEERIAMRIGHRDASAKADKAVVSCVS